MSLPHGPGGPADRPLPDSAPVTTASTPVRICDIGGWTDTWFGGPGRVLNVAVAPGVEVSITTAPGPDGVVLDLRSFGERYRIRPEAGRGRHRLVEAAVEAFPPPEGGAVTVTVTSSVPAGCGTGTSAAVTVALVGALAALRGQDVSSRDAARAAHRIEVEVLGGESGIQDQLAAALGGINFLEIDHYPEARVAPLPPWDEMGEVLSVVYLGRAHDSSAVHRQVIAETRDRRSVFSRLRDAAADARDAVAARDLAGFGSAMIANTAAQWDLHPALIGSDARRIIASAAAAGCLGWKVNGAGGEGGSVTLLSATPDDKAELGRRVVALGGRYRVLPLRPSTGGLDVRRRGAPG